MTFETGIEFTLSVPWPAADATFEDEELPDFVGAELPGELSLIPDRNPGFLELPPVARVVTAATAATLGATSGVVTSSTELAVPELDPSPEGD